MPFGIGHWRGINPLRFTFQEIDNKNTNGGALNRCPNASSIDFGAALSYNEFAGNDFFPSKASRFDDWTENFCTEKGVVYEREEFALLLIFIGTFSQEV